MKASLKIKYIFGLAFILVFSLIINYYREKLLEFSAYGYIGIFLSCFFANSTVLLPAPSSTIVFTFSSLYSPFLVAVAGALGATVGELIGYIAGVSGRKIINQEGKQGIQSHLEEYGVVAVFLFAFLPLPIFDLVGVASGMMRIKIFHFMLPCLLGKFLKMLIYAYAGAGFLPIISSYLQKL